MKNELTHSDGVAFLKQPHTKLVLAAAMAVIACMPLVVNANDREDDDNETHYQQINLVSDISGVAQLQDTNLVNAWGLAFGPTGPFWVGDNGTGKATLYAVTNEASGAPHVTRNARVVTIPGNGGVTGQIFNSNTNAFNGDVFAFVNTDGTISGWRPALGNVAEVLATRAGAIYAGATFVTNNGAPVLLVANFSEGTVDEYDSTLHLIGQFVDRKAPAGYAPFNIQTIGQSIFVMYAKQDLATHGVARGSGLGFIDTFDVARGTFHRFASGKSVGGKIREMNAPWGIALAPASFGSHPGQLLIGNFGSGTIMTFGANGKFRGLLRGSEECPITIDGLWALSFGSAGNAGVATDLYFTAGPNNETHGLFGVIQSVAEDHDDDDDGHGHHHETRY